jgi:hypothetical protein
MTSAADLAGTVFLAIVAIILIIVLVYLIIYYIRKRRESRMEHVGLYFDEHFRDVIKEWDLVSRTKVKDWSTDMSKRLEDVGMDLDKLMKFRKSFDTRLDKLESEAKKLEVL